jgi:hypothetical protein
MGTLLTQLACALASRCKNGDRLELSEPQRLHQDEKKQRPGSQANEYVYGHVVQSMISLKL